MGTCKDRTRFPKYVCDFIHVNLIKVYCNVYPDFNVGFTTRLMDIFGNDYAGIDLSIYSRLAKLLDKSKLLNLDEVVNDDDNVKHATDDDVRYATTVMCVRNILSSNQEHTWSEIDIDLLVNELAASELTLVMTRMKKFRAGARLHYIAAEMPNVFFFNSLPTHIKGMIDAVASILGKDPMKILKSLKRIKKAQKKGGKRLSLINKLASIYNGHGVDAIKKRDLKKLIRLSKDGCTEADAIQMVENTAIAQEGSGERLSLLNKLAAKYNANNGDVGSIMPNISELVKLYKCTEEQAIEMVKNTAIAQKGLGALGGAQSKLASLYNAHGGSEGNGRAAVKAHDDFATLTKSYGGDRDKAMEIIVKIAEQCDETFWTNYARLKAYIKDPKNNAVVTIEGKNVVVVYSKENGSRNDLYSWWKAQINWAGPNANATVQNQYGINAWERVGSVEYNALIELGVIFSDELVRSAYQQIRDAKVPGMFNKSEQGKKSTNELMSKLGGFGVFRGLKKG